MASSAIYERRQGFSLHGNLYYWCPRPVFNFFRRLMLCTSGYEFIARYFMCYIPSFLTGSLHLIIFTLLCVCTTRSLLEVHSATLATFTDSVLEFLRGLSASSWNKELLWSDEDKPDKLHEYCVLAQICDERDFLRTRSAYLQSLLESLSEMDSTILRFLLFLMYSFTAALAIAFISLWCDLRSELFFPPDLPRPRWKFLPPLEVLSWFFKKWQSTLSWVVSSPFFRSNFQWAQNFSDLVSDRPRLPFGFLMRFPPFRSVSLPFFPPFGDRRWNSCCSDFWRLGKYSLSLSKSIE